MFYMEVTFFDKQRRENLPANRIPLLAYPCVRCDIALMQAGRYPKPIVVVSKCLGFDHCRYDGDICESDFIKRLSRHAKIIPVCPEIEIGLGIPRPKIRLVESGGRSRLVQPATGRGLTMRLRDFSRKFLSALGDVDGFILKSRSPSCGIRDTEIFENAFDDACSGKASGLFAEQVLKRFDHLPIEDETRLRNKRTRHRFLTRLFTLASRRLEVPISHDKPYPPILSR
jgi:uncharacterized protein YbbK (DUF523 family)